MKILVTGSSGLIGTALTPELVTSGHDVASYNRAKPPSLEGFDGVVHLAGEPIAGRWTKQKKQAIRESRVAGTQVLCEKLAQLKHPPRVLVCASAIGYYGNRGTESLHEDSPAGTDFLATVVRDWEAATAPVIAAGIRVVNLRFGIVLSAKGGALAKMLRPFKLGAGGIVGDGRQYWSWVAIDDVVGAIQHVLVNEEIRGPVNVVAPNPVTNHEFTKTLGRVLQRPTVFPMPAFAARLLFGEMADALLLCSACVKPVRLEGTGYHFRSTDLEDTFRKVLSK